MLQQPHIYYYFFYVCKNVYIPQIKYFQKINVFTPLINIFEACFGVCSVHPLECLRQTETSFNRLSRLLGKASEIQDLTN